MESRRPLRLQKRDEILRKREVEPNVPEIDDTFISDEESIEDSETINETKSQPLNKEVSFSLRYIILSILVVGYTVYILSVYRRCSGLVTRLEEEAFSMQRRVAELESLLKSKYREVDVADYLEGARIIYDLTTPPYQTKNWLLGQRSQGYNGELAIDKVCTKGHCYSFNGSEGKLAIAFKDEKIIKKIGIIHPIFDSRKSAIKRFSLDCIVNNKEKRVGEFEYEIPGDSFQQFLFPPQACTGIVLRIKSNHGNPNYTCIYKVYAFE
ncbi:hypothetical protein NEHOM01_2139 [Nematocida homosporus]|uniref:uncharacterized protein n=1 Tax=Nematocida homosporus TaxID=1912981 RepID=UPI00221F4F07|nr:uncharacterized protein NEHOM01_2139 [Nematocida homosporus]KAI5187389.1 hypothetical protein NEHOM01_2139 [Nematocida homosporus]